MLAEPRIMGVVNVTPDSFSDGGLFFDHLAAITHARELIAQGADIVDIGGESTRPGAVAVSEDEELRRVIPVVEGLASGDGIGSTTISVDTAKATVASEAIKAGADFINDVTALRNDDRLAEVIAEFDIGCCLMHMQGAPRTMQKNPRYDDVVSEVKSFLEQRLDFAINQGIAEERIMLDPGIGFGKTVEHNLLLLARLDEIVAIGRPVVIGTSRKWFLGQLTGRDERQRLPGTIATNVISYQKGASVFRVHDVGEVKDSLTVARALLSASAFDAS